MKFKAQFMKPHNKAFRSLVSMRNFLLINVILFWGIVLVTLYHPQRIINLVVLTDKISFQPDIDESEGLMLLRSVPVSLAGFQNFEMSQLSIQSAWWPDFDMYRDGHVSVRIGPGKISCTPSDSQQAQLLFRDSRIKMSELKILGSGEIRLSLRSSETQNQILMKIRGLQPQLRMELLSDTIRVHLRNYAFNANHGKQQFKLTQNYDADIGILAASEEMMAKLDGDSWESLMFYDMQEFSPEHDDLLEVPVPTSRITFFDRRLGADRQSSLTFTNCISLGVGDQKKDGLHDRGIFIKKQDLSNFTITRLRANKPGKLHISLRGKTGIFRAGLDESVVNQVPTALATSKGKIALLFLILTGLTNFHLTFRSKRKTINFRARQ